MLTKLKTFLLKMLGEEFTAHLQALRFLWLLKTKHGFELEMQLVPDLVQPGETVVDIGANAANWTLYLQQAVGPTGKVFAFEADPFYARATELTIRWLGLPSVTLFPFGLSNQREQVPLKIFNAAGQRLSGTSMIDKNPEKPETVTPIFLYPLDDVCKEYPRLLETSFIKCDVEGYELYVLQGSRHLLYRARPIVVVEVGHFQEQGYHNRDLYRFFSELGYESYIFINDQQLALTDQTLGHPDSDYHNRIFVPAEKVSKIAPWLA